MIAFLVLTVALSCLAAPEYSIRPRLDGRIVGGSNVNIEDYPHQLSLQHFGGHICGASILSKTWAVTAAHCVDGGTEREYSVRAGSSIKGVGGQIVTISKIIVHHGFDKTTLDYDIALLQLNSTLTFDKTIQPISLASDEPAGGDLSTVTGWGALQEGGSSPSQLQGVDLNIVSRKDCGVSYGQENISDRMICAFAENKDSCQGDSGGPLISKKTLVGIVSWGYGCARPFYPGVYTNVANLRQWIKDKSDI